MARPGILSDAEIAALAEKGGISTPRPFDADQIQPASLDLRLGSKAYRLRASFLPIMPAAPMIMMCISPFSLFLRCSQYP